jgi:hypothetical protein
MFCMTHFHVLSYKDVMELYYPYYTIIGADVVLYSSREKDL